MPLELRFASPELRVVCERRAAAEHFLGEAAARKLRSRLCDIRAASDIREVGLGRPSYSQRGRVTFMLTTKRRLVVASAVTPVPRRADEQVDWAQVNIVEVVEIY